MMAVSARYGLHRASTVFSSTSRGFPFGVTTRRGLSLFSKAQHWYAPHQKPGIIRRKEFLLGVVTANMAGKWQTRPATHCCAAVDRLLPSKNAFCASLLFLIP